MGHSFALAPTHNNRLTLFPTRRRRPPPHLVRNHPCLAFQPHRTSRLMALPVKPVLLGHTAAVFTLVGAAGTQDSSNLTQLRGEHRKGAYNSYRCSICNGHHSTVLHGWMWRYL